MTPTETTAILRQFNEWRRGDEDLPQPDPREISEAIDAAVEMIDRLEAAERSDAESIAMYRKARDERDALRAAMEKIADWHGAWGPYPETNKSWCAMAIVTAREAVKPLYLAPGAKGE